MNYPYYNQFNLSNELAKSLSIIISQKENGNYTCKLLDTEISEHEELIISSFLDDDRIFNCAQISAEVTEPGIFPYNRTILEEDDLYFIIIDNETYEMISKISFTDKRNFEKNLKRWCILCTEYDGILNLKALIQRFPYLKEFFDGLDKWRAENGRVTLDYDILKSCTNKALSSDARKLKK